MKNDALLSEKREAKSVMADVYSKHDERYLVWAKKIDEAETQIQVGHVLKSFWRAVLQ